MLRLHASNQGHTTKIARRIAETLERDGVTVDLQSAHLGDVPYTDWDAVERFAHDGAAMLTTTVGG
jgi:menaquinone-dependent protoporphyrinogen IX oxidase